MSLTIVRQDIATMRTDAVVSATNESLVPDYGESLRILHACDQEKMLAACKRIGHIDAGHAVVTPSFGLKAKYVIHTVGPFYEDGGEDKLRLLADCYRACFAETEKLGLRSIAFPLIASGARGFPKETALKVARETITAYLETSEADVYLVLYDNESFEIGKARCGKIEDYLRDHYVPMRPFAARAPRMAELKMCLAEETPAPTQNTAAKTLAGLIGSSLPVGANRKNAMSLSDTVDIAEDTFVERLFRLIDERGMKDPDVYKKANIDRKLFSKIRSNTRYLPKKSTVIAFALALELSLEETNDLLGRAGYALSPSIRADVIVRYYIDNHNYNIFEVNETLFYYGEQPLGA